MKPHLPILFVLGLLISSQAAAEVEYEVATALSTGLLDRGEQLSAETSEISLMVSANTGSGTLIAEVYRLTPIGPGAQEFGEEVDYFLGYEFEYESIAFVVGANHITFPTDAGEANTTEIIWGIDTKSSWVPDIAMFYDLELEDFGAEMSLSHDAELLAGDAYMLARVGFGRVREDRITRNYWGLEGGIAWPLSDRMSIQTSLRYEQADEALFIAERTNGRVTRTDSDGVMFSMGLAISFD